jgi:mannose-1-phosphate guanylyltransferase
MESKTVKKHWGHEVWIADGTTTPYALKRILFKAGNRTSLQVHQHKVETNYVLSGTGTLLISNDVLDIDNFLANPLTEQEIAEYESTMAVIQLEPGTVFNVRPGFVHRVIATTDLEFIEASTTELDDVIRLQDDQHRTHGRIDHEHSS